MTENKTQNSLIPSDTASPISHKVNVLKLPAKGLTVKIAPGDGTLEALARHMDVLSISEFSAVLNVKRWHKDGVRVSGPINAKLRQECVITLEPVDEEISAKINAVFVPEESKLAKPDMRGDVKELMIDPEGDDVPEVFCAPYLDVGDIAAEFFILEINPYPRVDGAQEEAQIEIEEAGAESEDKKENPFAILASLKDRL